MGNEYYDILAPYYKYMHDDWEESVPRQAAMLDSVIKEFFGGKKKLLDVSCGIGTQALGLAALGYQVSASDLSESELVIAKAEAVKRKLAINFSQGDMREASKGRAESFDIVLSADNSIPHILTDGELLKAFAEFHKLLNTGGGCVLTVRDYVNFNPDNQKMRLVPRTAHEFPGGKLILFDRWDFFGDYYDMNTYIVKDTGGNSVETLIMRARYYCITTGRLEQLLRRSGFTEVRTLKDRFVQPVIIATKA